MKINYLFWFLLLLLLGWYPQWKKLSCTFFSSGFTISGFVFTFFCPFELIFIYGVHSIYFICMWISTFPIPFIKKTIFSPFFVLDNLIIDLWIYFWAAYPLNLLHAFFNENNLLFDFCMLAKYFEIKKFDASISSFLIQDCFGNLDIFFSYM